MKMMNNSHQKQKCFTFFVVSGEKIASVGRFGFGEHIHSSMSGTSSSQRWIYLKEKIDSPYNDPEGLD